MKKRNVAACLGFESEGNVIKKWLTISGLVLGLWAFQGWTQDASDSPQGLRYGPLTLHGSLDLSAGYDSNPEYERSGETGQTELRAQPALDLLLKKGDDWAINSRGWLLYDWYISGQQQERSIANQNHYGESVDGFVVTPRDTRFAISEFYEYQDRANSVMESGSSGTFYNGSFQDRQNLNVGTTMITPLGEKTRVNLGLSYSDLWYANTNLFGYSSYDVQAGLARQISRETDWRLDGGYDIQHSEGSQDDSQGWRLLTGIGSSPTAKMSYRLEGGVMGYAYNGSGNSSGRGGSSFGWTYDATGNWRVSRLLTVHVSGTSTYQPAEDTSGNYTEVQSLMAGFTYQLTARLTDDLNAGFHIEDYKNSFRDSGEHRTDDQGLFYDRLSYRLNRNADLFIGLEYSRNQSTISTFDYSRLFINAGASLHF